MLAGFSNVTSYVTFDVLLMSLFYLLLISASGVTCHLLHVTITCHLSLLHNFLDFLLNITK